jgi:hypothetical protein
LSSCQIGHRKFEFAQLCEIFLGRRGKQVSSGARTWGGGGDDGHSVDDDDTDDDGKNHDDDDDDDDDAKQ